jgi:hypothetical protein
MTSPTINAAADKINPIAVTCSSTVCLPKLLFDLCQDQVFVNSIEKFSRKSSPNLLTSASRLLAESTYNPFEGNESIFLSTDNRAIQRRKGKHKSKFKVGEHEDLEIEAEIRKGKIVNILYDSSK